MATWVTLCLFMVAAVMTFYPTLFRTSRLFRLVAGIACLGSAISFSRDRPIDLIWVWIVGALFFFALQHFYRSIRPRKPPQHLYFG
jgi:hypothetical protein